MPAELKTTLNDEELNTRSLQAEQLTLECTQKVETTVRACVPVYIYGGSIGGSLK